MRGKMYGIEKARGRLGRVGDSTFLFPSGEWGSPRTGACHMGLASLEPTWPQSRSPLNAPYELRSESERGETNRDYGQSHTVLDSAQRALYRRACQAQDPCRIERLPRTGLFPGN